MGQYQQVLIQSQQPFYWQQTATAADPHLPDHFQWGRKKFFTAKAPAYFAKDHNDSQKGKQSYADGSTQDPPKWYLKWWCHEEIQWEAKIG